MSPKIAISFFSDTSKGNKRWVRKRNKIIKGMNLSVFIKMISPER